MRISLMERWYGEFGKFGGRGVGFFFFIALSGGFFLFYEVSFFLPDPFKYSKLLLFSLSILRF